MAGDGRTERESQAMGLLEIDATTTFVISPSGRIARENDPDRSAGPRLFFGGCSGGNLLSLRHDVSDEIAAAAAIEVRGEPPWLDAFVKPRCLEALVELMSKGAPAQIAPPVITYRLPHGLVPASDVRIVAGEAQEGEALLRRLSTEGMPATLRDAGFASIADFWDPWCVALVGDEIAATAFAARLGPAGAETGVYTFPGFRGRGLAAAVTAAWSSLPSLAQRELFYSTHTTNLSSQRVATRLGLTPFGASIRIG